MKPVKEHSYFTKGTHDPKKHSVKYKYCINISYTQLTNTLTYNAIFTRVLHLKQYQGQYLENSYRWLDVAFPTGDIHRNASLSVAPA